MQNGDPAAHRVDDLPRASEVNAEKHDAALESFQRGRQAYAEEFVRDGLVVDDPHIHLIFRVKIGIRQIFMAMQRPRREEGVVQSDVAEGFFFYIYGCLGGGVGVWEGEVVGDGANFENLPECFAFSKLAKVDNLFTSERFPDRASPRTMSVDSPRRSCFSNARASRDCHTFSSAS